MTTRRFSVAITTDGAGAATAYSPYLSGKLTAIHYVKDVGANPFANGVDFTITAEATGETLWAENDVNASASRYPRVATHTTAGVASLYAAGGTAVTDQIRMSRDRVKIVIASGGATKVGAFIVMIEE
jgi:hypothetical protein